MGMVKNDVLELTFSKVPMLKPLLALIIGIMIGHFFDISIAHNLPFALLLCFIVLLVIYQKKKMPSRKMFFAVVFYLIMLLLGMWRISVNQPAVDLKHFSHYKGLQVVGLVQDDPVIKEKTIRFPIQVIAMLDSNHKYAVEGKVMITILRDSVADEAIAYGDEFIFRNTISETKGPLNPKEFDYKAYLANKQIWHQAFLKKSDFKIQQSGKGNFVLSQSLVYRQKLIDKFSKYIKDPEAFQIAIALIFGYRSQVEASTLDAFTNTGTIHVLSVSGLHVSLVFGFLTMLLFWLDRFRYGKLVRCLIIFITVWLYVILTGMSPPILRAGIMISFFIASTAFGRRQIDLNTLLASAFFILVFAPQYLFDVGFQLSYAAILGILVLYPICKALWLPKYRWLQLIVEYCYVSIAAQLFTLPFALYYFGQFPIYFLIANLFIAIPSTVIMYLGVVLVISPLEFFNIYIGKLLDWLLVFSVDGLQFISRLPMAVYKGIVWDFGQVVILSVVLVLLVIAFNYVNKRALLWTLVFILLLNSYTVFQKVNYNTYCGIRIYNVRSELAIVHIDKGKAVLCTTLDSLSHPTLKFSVLPDLLQYVNQENITMVNLENEKRKNYQLNLGDKKYLILEDRWSKQDSISSYDFIVWRKNNRNKLDFMLKENKNAKVIVDGSNSQKTVANMDKEQTNKESLYLLKNNFAYVWDSD